MKHYLGYKGYAVVYLLALLILVIVALAISGLLQVLDNPKISQLSGVLVLAAIFIAGYIATDRFVKVEGRPAMASEAAQVALEMAKYASIVFLGGYIFILLIDWSFGDDTSKLTSPKAIQMFLVAWMGFMLFSYISLLLNFLLSGVVNRQSLQN